MKTIKRLWVPMLLGVLLIATLVGVASARPNARPTQQAWRVLAVSPHACVADQKNTDYNQYGAGLECWTPNCEFYCAIDFPAAGEQAVGAVNVKRVTMHAFDNDTNYVEFRLSKQYSPNRATQEMAAANTTDSTANPQTVMDTSIDNNPVYRSQVPYLWLKIGHANHEVYGFYIHYTWEVRSRAQ